MTYIKIDDKPYFNFENLRKIISISGEKLKLNETTFELKRDMITEQGNLKHDFLFDILENKIIKKSNEIKLLELKEKKKFELLQKSKNDPEFVFEKNGAKEKYQKMFDDIEKCEDEKALEKII